MRIMIVSDSHGRHRNLENALEEVGKIDLLLHLGDVEGGEDYIEAIAPCPVKFVAGNNDYYSFQKNERECLIGGKRIFMTHGHYYFVSIGTKELKREALRRGVDIAMYGHTHIPLVEEEEGLLILNPGSISLPRQRGRKPSYMVLEIGSNGETKVHTYYLE